MKRTDDIRIAALAYISDDVECAAVSPEGDRIACSTPIEYPDGDHVVAWVTPINGEVLVTDYGKGYEHVLSHSPAVRATLKQFGRGFAEGQGVDFLDGRVSARVGGEDVGEAIWRVASASAQLAQAGVVFKPRRRGRDGDFERKVANVFSERQIGFESHAPLEGASGRTHHATFFVPSRRAAIEPVSPSGIWSQVSSVYGKFGDLSHGNGAAPRRVSLIDDRESDINPQDAEFLGQVSDVIRWSRQDDLMEAVTQ